MTLLVCVSTMEKAAICACPDWSARCVVLHQYRLPLDRRCCGVDRCFVMFELRDSNVIAT